MQKRRPVVLVFPDANVTFFGFKGGEAFKKMYRLPPLGILYVSAALEAAGWPTVIVNEEAQPRLLDRLDWLRSLDPLFVGIYTNILNEPLVCDMIRQLREQTRIPVVAGGPGCFRPAPFLRAGADMMCEGEGEATIVDMARHYEGELGLEEIEGIYYLKDGEVATTGKRKPIPELDSIAFPDWLKTPVPYYSRYSLTVREPYFTIVTNRGCAMRCDYCGSPATWQNVVRRRSVENVIEELKLLHKHFQFRYIDIFDDIFVYGGEWETEFCEALLRLPFKFNWGAIAYPKKIDFELLKLMQRAGCDTLKIGVQSTSPVELKSIHRHPNTVERGYELIQNARKLGMMTSIDFIFGLPGSTRESMQETVEYMFKADPTIIKIAELEFYPGSPLYDRRHEVMTDVPLAWMEDLHRQAVRRFFARPRKIWEVFRLMLRNPATFRHALRYSEFMVRHVLLGRGDNQVELQANHDGEPQEHHRTLETAGPRWLLNAGRRKPTGSCST